MVVITRWVEYNKENSVNKMVNKYKKKYPDTFITAVTGRMGTHKGKGDVIKVDILIDGILKKNSKR